PHASGHIYCTLKDSTAQISLVVWRTTVQRLRFTLEEGMEVNIRGRVEVYAPRGNYQLIADAIEPKGMGELQLAFRQLYERLGKEGLFDPARKRPLPAHPRRVGIVTAPTGAAIRDMLRIIARRDPRVSVVIYPARVQGEGAAEQVAAGIAYLNEHAVHLGLDLIIAGRGGGSLEDLWAFNEEIVARAIHASALPVVSAVGHEIDTTIADLVADVRAATPSEAAELVIPELAALTQQTDELAERLQDTLLQSLDQRRQALDLAAERFEARSPARVLREQVQRLDFLAERYTFTMRNRLERDSVRLTHLGEHLEGLSPLKVLARGYSVVRTPAGKVIDSVKKVRSGDELRIRVSDGDFGARAT
ncbi:MAG: exodeoxyribonuclease VII large subunit, partial [Planctomycetes bacterium]|nr:exodeoxyribonuclease VII large subunit [Planctomycetota bacterium]